jgi:D-alanyl-D-alanine carboxypeptidase (penicillin-binding protein 5/6)
VTSAKRDNMRLISVVMGSPSVKAREDASAALLNYGYTFFETTKLKSARDPVLKPHVYKGESDYVTVGIPNDIIVTIARGQSATLTTSAKITTKEPLIAPLSAGQPLGELTVTDSTGQVVARSPLVALAAVPAGGLWTRASDSIRLWFH